MEGKKMNHPKVMILGLFFTMVAFSVTANETQSSSSTAGQAQALPEKISAPESKETYMTPDSIQGSTKVDTDEMVELITGVESLKLIDARILEDRVYGYI